MSARGRGQDYGERSCTDCGRPFKAQGPTARRCQTCRVVHEAKRMRSHTMACDSCGKHFHRRDGRDLYCPTCHIEGWGEKRWAPGPELERPCSVCGKRNPSVAPNIDVCSTCVAAPDRQTKVKVDRRLHAYEKDARARLASADQHEEAPASTAHEAVLTDAEIVVLDKALADYPEADATMQVVYDRLSPVGLYWPDGYGEWLAAEWRRQHAAGAEHATGKFSAWLPEEAERYRTGHGGPDSRYGRLGLVEEASV